MPQTLDSDQLRTFIAIADSGSFTRAGEQVHKTQSAVSMQVKRLEETVGRRLFARDGRTSRLTADGEFLLDYARRIVRMSDEAIAQFTAPEQPGLVRLGTPDDYADRFLPELLARFAATHPLVQLQVECGPSAELIEKTRMGELELAIVTCDPDRVHGELIRSEPLVWATSARHCTHELEEVPLALSHTGCSWRQLAINALERVGRPYRIAYASGNSLAVAAAVTSGLAVAALPEVILRPGMRVLKEQDGFPEIGDFQIGLVRAPGDLPAPAHALAEHVTGALDEIGRTMLAAE